MCVLYESCVWPPGNTLSTLCIIVCPVSPFWDREGASSIKKNEAVCVMGQ